MNNRDFFRTVHEWLKPYIERGEIIRVHAELYLPMILGQTTHFIRCWLIGRMALDLDEVAEPLVTAAWKALKG